MRTNKLESKEHTFLVQAIKDYLTSYIDKININLTQLPDITFDYNSKTYAFEIETPRRLAGKRDRLKDKANKNNELYPNRWWFVPTRSAYAKTFKKYGKVIIRTQLPSFLDSIFKPILHNITSTNSAKQTVTISTTMPEKQG